MTSSLPSNASADTILKSRLRNPANFWFTTLDDNWILTVFDRSLMRDGHVALWTQDDNVTRFEEIEITPLPERKQSTPLQQNGGRTTEEYSSRPEIRR